MSTLTGLSEQPTPEELAAFINADQTFGNPQGHEGLDVRDNDGDTLFALTASGFADVLRPLVQVFYDRGQLDLLLDLFEILHLHWASREGGAYQSQNSDDPRYSKLSGIARYEPLLLDTFENTHVLDAVRKLLVETEPLRLSSGRRDQPDPAGGRAQAAHQGRRSRESRGRAAGDHRRRTHHAAVAVRSLARRDQRSRSHRLARQRLEERVGRGHHRAQRRALEGGA